MVEVNFTLVVQACHFLVAWWVLDRFLFRPVVAVIERERAGVNRLEQTIEKGRKQLQDEKEHQKSLWEKSRKKFGKNAPDIEVRPELSYSTVLCPVAVGLEKKERQRLVAETKEQIVKKALKNV